tara:strand:- start:1607 stop:2434 length:828 start_codon:yes stop_codon:yes gene_type:complete
MIGGDVIILDEYNNTFEYLKNQKVARHATLIDPEKQTPEEAAKIVQIAIESGTDLILIGGSTTDKNSVDKTVEIIQETMELQQWAATQNGIFEDQTAIVPVILFPNASATLSKNADALLFMTLLNSKSTKYLIKEQLKATKYISDNNIETISCGYLVFEPGMRVGEVGDAELIKITDLDTTIAYSRLAKYFEFKILYLEAGSGANYPIPEEIISTTKKEFEGILFVGGGIKNSDQAKKAALAGADWIVTGNLLESFTDYKLLKSKLKEVINAIKT